MNKIILLLLICIATPLYAVEGDVPQNGSSTLFENIITQTPFSNDVVMPSDTNPPLEQIKVNNEFWYIVMLCLLSIISLLIVLTFLKDKEHSARDVVNATGLTLIIFGTIILVLVVSTSEQLTAAIGILGAIAGYLFRSAQEKP